MLLLSCNNAERMSQRLIRLPIPSSHCELCEIQMNYIALFTARNNKKKLCLFLSQDCIEKSIILEAIDNQPVTPRYKKAMTLQPYTHYWQLSSHNQASYTKVGCYIYFVIPPNEFGICYQSVCTFSTVNLSNCSIRFGAF